MIVFAVLLLVLAGTVYAITEIGIVGTNNVSISSGANVEILSGTVSNGTATNACTESSGTWQCHIATLEQGHNLTTTLVVENTGKGTGQVFTVSQMISGATDGKLIDEYNGTSALTLASGASGDVSIIFESNANAVVGDLIEINSTVF